MAISKKIFIAEPKDFSENALSLLKQYAEVDLNINEKIDLSDALSNYDVFWFRIGHKIQENIIPKKLRCKILATPVTGIDHIDEALCEKLGIKILCLRGETEFLKEVRATAELTIGLALNLMRHIPLAIESVKDGHWNRDAFRGNELYKKTVGIIGFGRLGQIVARYFTSFGMRVLAYDVKQISPPPQVQIINSLEELISESDLVSLHVNYLENNRMMINRDTFKSFKEGAFFINTSRGGLVDEQALLDALQSKKLGGAALDVLQGEPEIDRHNPLIIYSNEHSNLLIVPHIGGNTYESFEKTEMFIAGKIVEEITRWRS